MQQQLRRAYPKIKNDVVINYIAFGKSSVKILIKLFSVVQSKLIYLSCFAFLRAILVTGRHRSAVSMVSLGERYFMTANCTISSPNTKASGNVKAIATKLASWT